MYGLTLNIWASMDATDINEDDGESWHMGELDYTLSYGFSPAEWLDLEGGVIWYTFPSADTTGEVYAGATLADCPLSPSVTVYYDFDEVDGWYVNAGISHTYEATDRLGLSAGAWIGWANGDYHEAYYGTPARASVADVLLSVSIDYALTEAISVSVCGSYSDLPDNTLEELTDKSEVVFGGVSVSMSF